MSDLKRKLIVTKNGKNQDDAEALGSCISTVVSVILVVLVWMGQAYWAQQLLFVLEHRTVPLLSLFGANVFLWVVTPKKWHCGLVMTALTVTTFYVWFLR